MLRQWRSCGEDVSGCDGLIEEIWPLLTQSQSTKPLEQGEARWIRLAYLINKHVCTEVLERQLELLEAVVDGDLDGDGSIRAGIVADVMAWSSHDGGGCEVGVVDSKTGSPDGGDVGSPERRMVLGARRFCEPAWMDRWREGEFGGCG